MFTYKRTQKFEITYLIITLLAIKTTVATLVTTFNPEAAVFENQTCQHNKCLKFNLIQIGNSWEFVTREVTPSCCSYAAINVTLLTQVPLNKSPYKMANATPTTSRDTEEDYEGPPQIDDVRVTFSEDGFPKFVSDSTSTSTTIPPAMQPIPKPAAQKATIAKKNKSDPGQFYKDYL